MKPSLDLTAIVESVDGTEGESFPISADRDAERQMFVQSFSNKLNIGYDNFTGVLPRDFRKTYGSPRILQNLRVVDAGGNTVWEGRVDNVPPGRNNSVTAVGWYDALKDSSGVAEVYTDKSLERWGSIPINLQAVILAANYAPADGTNESGQIKLPLLRLPWSTPGLPFTASVYTAPPGVNIYTCTADLIRTSSDWNTADANYSLYMTLATDDAFASYDDTSDLAASVGSSYAATVTATTTGRRYARIHARYDAANATVDSKEHAILASDVTVTGDHGLTNIYASEVIKHAIGKYCPLITADSNSVYDTTYAIGQLVFDGGTVDDIVTRCNAFHLYELGVWADRTLWFQPQRDTTDYDYLLSIYYGDGLDIEGPRIEDDEPCNGVWVYYTSVTTGRRERVGPLGDAAPYDTAGDASLLVTDDENPCNREGVNRFPSLEISFPCSSSDAIQLGALWLAEKQVPVSIGTGVASGHVRNRAGAWVPAHNIESGDRIKFTHEDVIRRVYSATYSPSSHTCSLAFERPPATFEGINERIEHRLQARNIS